MICDCNLGDCNRVFKQDNCGKFYSFFGEYVFEQNMSKNMVGEGYFSEMLCKVVNIILSF